ncbi:MAG: sigma-70 family RNA polymerase sigma factor [Leadbetterella sp.]|nr:sigma-70 family RNA polymerase sigma factor [Leadbetterella sp.]
MEKQIAALKNGDRREIEKLYNQYKSGFILFLGRYGLPREELTDIYQDSVVALIENARKGLMDNLEVELKTYLFAIGKFMVFKRLKKDREISKEDLIFEWYDTGNEETESPRLRAALNRLGGRCYELLNLFYYQGKKLDEIQVLMGYDKKDVLKSQKSRCLKQLKEIIENG